MKAWTIVGGKLVDLNQFRRIQIERDPVVGSKCALVGYTSKGSQSLASFDTFEEAKTGLAEVFTGLECIRLGVLQKHLEG